MNELVGIGGLLVAAWSVYVAHRGRLASMRDTMYAEQLAVLRSSIETAYAALLAYDRMVNHDTASHQDAAREEIVVRSQALSTLWARGLAVLPERSSEALTQAAGFVATVAAGRTDESDDASGDGFESVVVSLVMAARHDLGSVELSKEAQSLLRPNWSAITGKLDDRRGRARWDIAPGG